MSSRLGNVVYADDVYKELIEIEKKVITSDLSDSEIRKIAMAAFKYGMLKYDKNSGITFDMDEVTQLEGNTGPYILYSLVRAISVLSQSSVSASTPANTPKTANTTTSSSASINNYEPDKKEKQLVINLLKFPTVVSQAATELSPHYISTYAYELSRDFNSFYATNTILSKVEDEMNFRLQLVTAYKIVITTCLDLLGIDPVERM